MQGCLYVTYKTYVHISSYLVKKKTTLNLQFVDM